MRFYENDIAVVAYTGMFPEADNEEDFWSFILEGKCAIRDLVNDPVNVYPEFKYHYSTDKTAPEKSYSRFGTQIEIEKFAVWAKENNLDRAQCTAVEIAMHELFRRMQVKVPNLFEDVRTECVISQATGDPYSVRARSRKIVADLIPKLPLSAKELEAVLNDQKSIVEHPPRLDSLPKDCFGSLSYESVKKRFGIAGPCAFVDAACASSLAAIMIAVNRLRANECDLMISGGIDFGLGILTLMAFSRVQVLSPGIMNPFDESSDGMNQGEAAGLFALMRIKDAKAKNLKIHGVIRNCDGSSDGIQGGLVEPTERGQVLAYERAYRNVPLQPLSYLECHGTGTVVGDRTELSSSSQFFHPLPPIGSVKANVGHTIGAAGSVSLTKALKIIETHIIPHMPNFNRPQKQSPHMIYEKNHTLPNDKNVRIGVSSFGFGGANYHLVIDEYLNEEILPVPEKSKEFKFVLNGTAEVDLEFARELILSSRIKIPPISLPQYDSALLGGTLATEKLFNELNLKLSPQMREQIGVISTTNNYLDNFVSCHDKSAYLEVRARIEPENLSKDGYKIIDETLKQFLPITEDTFPGSLNNLIAGKVTKDFDLKGVNFNLLAEQSSLGMALTYTRSMLESSSGAFVILHFNETIAESGSKLERRTCQAWLVSDLEFALKANLPIAMEISDIELVGAQTLRLPPEVEPHATV